MSAIAENKRNYTKEKITLALQELALGEGSLAERVQEAHRVLARCSDLSGHEYHFALIKRCLGSVQNGDYSQVTNEEYNTVARTIFDMALGLQSEMAINWMEKKSTANAAGI